MFGSDSGDRREIWIKSKSEVTDGRSTTIRFAFGQGNSVLKTAMSLYEIVHTEDRGRAVIATQDVPKGTDILSEQSIAYVVKDRYRMLVCQWCCKFCYGADQQVYALSEADKYRYCSQACIEKDYTAHKYEVDILGRLDKVKDLTSSDNEAQKAIELEPMRLIIRAAAKKKVLEDESAAGKNGKDDKEHEKENEAVDGKSDIPSGLANSFDDLMKLEGKMDEREDTEALQQYLTVAAKKLSILLRLAGLSLKDEEIKHLLLACQCNAHTIGGVGHTLKQHVSIGYYPLVSMLNHSCMPNCIHYFVCTPGSPPVLKIRAITDINKGQELLYSYVPLYQSTESRKSHLSSAYSFNCTCPRCVYIDSEDTNKTTPLAASGEAQHLDAMYSLFDMSHDEAIFEPESSTVLNGITLCMQRIIANSKDTSGRKVELDMLLSKLNTTLHFSVNSHESADMKSGGLSHFHQTLFYGYNSAVQTIESLVLVDHETSVDGNSNSNLSLTDVDRMKYLRYLVLYGLLALSCIKTFVGIPQLETAQIEYTVYKALKRILSLDKLNKKDTVDITAFDLSSGREDETLLRNCTVVAMDILINNKIITVDETSDEQLVLFQFIKSNQDGLVVKLLGHEMTKILQVALFDHSTEGDASKGGKDSTVEDCYLVMRDSFKETAEKHAAICRLDTEEALV